MQFNLIIVTYNSEKWIDTYFEKLLGVKYECKDIHIVIVDNNSQDATMDKLDKFKQEYGHKYGEFLVIKNTENIGFGKANNIGVQSGIQDYVFFTNIDTELFPDTFEKLKQEIRLSNPSVALWELRQLPYEHPKYYDILTHETSWSSGAAFVIKRVVYEQIEGFDNHIFMYGEDVDLSWRVRALGYKLKYCPHIPIIHHSYEDGILVKSTQHIYGTIYNTLLRYRYGSLKDIVIGHVYAALNILKRKRCNYSRRLFAKEYVKRMKDIPYFIKWRIKNKHVSSFNTKFIRMQYENRREGAFYMCKIPEDRPLVSIVIRTCQRPQVLKEAIISCVQQTYSNIEIIVVEDGENKSQKMIEEAFEDSRVRYYATQSKVGRSEAGNIGMTVSKGTYISFLDDDDLYYAEHIEVLVNAIQESDNRVAYALAEESKIIIHSKDPYEYTEKAREVFYKQEYNQALLFYHNYMPIQCVLFERSLFLEYGGLDTTLDALEDWDLWVRYACHTDFSYVPKVTSLYRVPYESKKSLERQSVLDEALILVRNKHKTYQVTTSPGSIGSDVQKILDMYNITRIKNLGKKFKNKYPKMFKVACKVKNILKRYYR